MLHFLMLSQVSVFKKNKIFSKRHLCIVLAEVIGVARENNNFKKKLKKNVERKKFDFEKFQSIWSSLLTGYS